MLRGSGADGVVIAGDHARQMACVDLIPVGQFAGEPVHRLSIGRSGVTSA
jgi:hypothetical protein